MEILKMRAVEIGSRIQQQVKAMEENLRKRHDELDQHTHQLQTEHQKKLQELEALHEDKIKEKEAEPEEDDHVHS